MCLRLVEAEGYLQVEHLGAAGGERGRDIVASRDGLRVVFQCKRVKVFGSADGKNEIDKLRSLPTDRQPDEVVFIVACAVSDHARSEIRKAWADESTCWFWAGSELDGIVKRYDFILREFFNLSTVSPSSQPFVLPSTDPQDFQGREKELTRLEALLISNDASSPSRIALVSGSGGVGKSVLACRFANRHREQFPDGVIGLRVGRRDADSLVRELAQSLGHPIDSQDERPAYAIVQELLAHRKALLILDNAEDISIVRNLLPSGDQCAALVTSRDGSFAPILGLPDDSVIHLSVLPTGEARAFLAALIGHTRLATDSASADRLLTLTGRLPLALRISGTTLREQPGRFLSSYAASLEDERVRLMRLRVYGDEELDVRASLSLSLDMLDQASTTIFFACSGVCAEAGFSLSVARAAAGYGEEEGWRCLGSLRRFSLIENHPSLSERFVLHPLVRVFAREVAEERGLLPEARDRHARFLMNAVSSEIVDDALARVAVAQDVEDVLLAAEWLLENQHLDTSFAVHTDALLDSLGRWEKAASLAEQHTALATARGDGIQPPGSGCSAPATCLRLGTSTKPLIS